MMHFLTMGGYAAYVWPAYGITFIGIASALLLTVRAYRRAKSRVAALNISRS